MVGEGKVSIPMLKLNPTDASKRNSRRALDKLSLAALSDAAFDDDDDVCTVRCDEVD